VRDAYSDVGRSISNSHKQVKAADAVRAKAMSKLDWMLRDQAEAWFGKIRGTDPQEIIVLTLIVFFSVSTFNGTPFGMVR
jgi:hypothetical protein